MDEFLRKLIESSTEISLEKRNQILQLIEWDTRKTVRKCKQDIMTLLIDQANKNATIYEAVVLINQLYENEENEKTNGGLGSEGE